MRRNYNTIYYNVIIFHYIMEKKTPLFDIDQKSYFSSTLNKNIIR
jgi:hypothetical protein